MLKTSLFNGADIFLLFMKNVVTLTPNLLFMPTNNKKKKQQLGSIKTLIHYNAIIYLQFASLLCDV